MSKKIALVTLANNDDLYIQEWIDYNLKLGFDDIHIFQNNWRTNKNISNPNVHFHEYDGFSYQSNEPIWVRNIQAKCFTEFGRKYYEEYEWVAFFDIDEFLVLKKTDNVKDFIKKYDNHNCVIINWAMFGDSDISTFSESYTSQLKRFTKRKSDLHLQFKSICKIGSSFEHQVHWINGNWVDTHFNVGNGPFNHTDNSIAQLNHYYIRTYPEFCTKRDRGGVDNINVKKPLETFQENNFNEVEDTEARDFLYETKGKKILYVDYGGLGDHLAFSTLPEICDRNGYELYLSSKTKFRDNQIFELVWKLNPFFKGMTNEEPNCGHDGYTNLDNYDYKHSIHRNYEIKFGFENSIPEQSTFPIIYYTPNKIDDNYTLIDLNSVSLSEYNLDIIKSHILSNKEDRFIHILPTYSKSIIDDNFLSELNITNITTRDIFHYADLIFSSNKFICLWSGSSVLGSSIKNQYNRSLEIDCFKNYTNHPNFGSLDKTHFWYSNINYISC
jgi:hypothetical protein